MINDFAIGFGAVLLSCGVCSPAIGTRVNSYGPELVFFGLAMIVVALYSDWTKDRQAR